SKARTNTGSNFDCLTRIRNRLQQLQSSKRVLFGIEREGRSVFSQFMTIAIVGIFFLQTSRIRQEYFQQVGSASRTVNRAAKALLDEARQVACMIDVRVRDENRVQRSGLERRILPVAFTQFFQPLKQSAVDEHAGSVGLD